MDLTSAVMMVASWALQTDYLTAGSLVDTTACMMAQTSAVMMAASSGESMGSQTAGLKAASSDASTATRKEPH